MYKITTTVLTLKS